MWEDSELACDIWNDRWSTKAFTTIFGDKGKEILSRKAFTGCVVRKLAAIMEPMQTAQREVYSVRRIILFVEKNGIPMTSISRCRKRFRSCPSLILPEA